MSTRSHVLTLLLPIVCVGVACEPTDESSGDAGAQPAADTGTAGVDAAPPSTGSDAGPPAEPCPEPSGEGTTHQGVIDADETWTLEGSPHVITFNLSIEQGTLTIEACAVVRVQEGLHIGVGSSGPGPAAALVARGEIQTGSNGEQRRPVRFVADEAGTHWGSLRVFATGRVDLEVVDLEDGGAHATAQDNGGTLLASGGGGPSLARIVRAVDVRVLRSEGFGVNLTSFAAFSADSRDLVIHGAGQSPSPSNVVTDYPLYIAPPALQTIPTGDYTGNAVDAIQVFNQSKVRIDETFHDRGVPYRIERGFAISPEATLADGGGITLTLEAGVTLLFSRDPTYVSFVSLGAGRGALPEDLWPVKLIADGTAEKPIVLGSAEEVPAAGDWGGISWPGGPATGNVMRHVRIEHAGGDSGTGSFGCGPGINDAAIIITHWRPDEDFIDDLTVSDSAGGGIVCGWASDDDGPDLAAGNTFTDIAGECDVSRWKNESSPACPGNDSIPDCL